MHSWVNLANALTALRLLLVVPLLFFVYLDELWLSLACLTLFLLLDILDGMAARAFHCQTLAGQNFDLLTDGVALLGLLFLLFFTGRISSFFALALAVPLICFRGVGLFLGWRAKGNTVVKSSSQYWKAFRGTLLFGIPVCFIVHSLVAAYILLAMLYVAEAKFLTEVRSQICS